MALNQTISRVLEQAAKATGVSLRMLRAICLIESSGNPKVVTGQYKGLFQLSAQEFKKYGGKGSILDATQNAMAAARLLKALRDFLSRRLGRHVTDAEVYLAHQQGVGGASAHLADRQRKAWASMHSTTEGKQKGEAWAKRAVWGNLPTAMKTKFGRVENVTSGDFIDFWVVRYDRALEQTKIT